MGLEYCSTLGKGNTTHGYCDRKGWPKPFLWLNYIGKSMLKDKSPWRLLYVRFKTSQRKELY